MRKGRIHVCDDFTSEDGLFFLSLLLPLLLPLLPSPPLQQELLLLLGGAIARLFDGKIPTFLGLSICSVSHQPGNAANYGAILTTTILTVFVLLVAENNLGSTAN